MKFFIFPTKSSEKLVKYNPSTSKYIQVPLIFTIIFTIFTQNSLLSKMDIQLFEQYFENTEQGDVSNETILEQIDYFNSNPIDLTRSTTNQIAELPTINYFEAYLIYEYIHRNKDITMREIADYAKLNPLQYYVLDNCATIAPPQKRLSARIRERSSFQMETPIGYQNSKYVGEQWNLLQNYVAHYQADFTKISAGATINKNAGELHIDEYTSGYAMLSNKSISLIVGDYSLYSGMGSIFGSTYSAWKGVNAISPAVTYTNKISPYSSKLDYNRMRGVATRIDIPLFSKNHLLSSVWYSNAPRSATLSKDSSYISSIFTTGYYRTTTDIAKKNSIYEKNLGGTLEFSGCDYSIGGLLTYLDYGKEIRTSSGRIFSGKDGYLSSLFGTMHFNNINLSGEIAVDNNSNFGVKIGTACKSKSIDFAIHFRSFDANFRSPYGAMFGEYSYASNELGLYTSIIWRPAKQMKLTSYFDWFRSYKPTYTVDTNVTGFDIFSQFDYSPNTANSMSGRINYKSKTDEATVNKRVTFFQKDKLNLRFEYKHLLSKQLLLKSRVDGVYINNKDVVKDDMGMALFVEGSYAIADWLKIQSRITYFSTSSYASAIYQLDYYYPGYSYSTALYDEGARSFIALRISPTNWCDIYLRYVNLYKPNAASLGSGNEQIRSNSQNRIYCQFEVKL